uniref:Ilp is an apoptosis inhibitor n=1 Tax=Colletotrichum fructicola (strain Nara gc5) TaxID=1213859 RepID=L2GF52_COLFN
MAYHHSSGSSAGSSSFQFQYAQVGHSFTGHPGAPQLNGPPLQPFQESQFDIFEWYPKFQSCLRYFLDHAQYTGPIQAVAAFVNIQLPFQKPHNPVLSSKQTGPSSPAGPGPSTPSTARAAGKLPLGAQLPSATYTTLTPYRRNYMFAAKSETWLKVKTHYDMDGEQQVPFLRPLQNVTEKEIQGAESSWSEWLAMQDWMLGPRAPDQGPRIKVEDE